MREIENVRAKRPWWRLHVTTLLALAVVGSAVGYCESLLRFADLDGHGQTYFELSGFGWPLACLYERTSGIGFFSTKRTSDVSWRSDRAAAAFDLSALVLMLISTVIAGEVWRRRDLAWWQYSVRSFFVLTTVGTIVAVLYTNGISIPW